MKSGKIISKLLKNRTIRSFGDKAIDVVVYLYLFTDKKGITIKKYMTGSGKKAVKWYINYKTFLHHRIVNKVLLRPRSFAAENLD